MASMRRYIHIAGMVPAFHLLKCRYEGDEYRLLMLHAEDETYPNERTKQTYAGDGHAHEVYHICLYTGGQGRFSLRQRRRPCRRGALVVTSPGEWHDFNVRPGESATTIEITLSGESEDQARQLQIPFHELLAGIVGAPVRPVNWPVQLNNRQTQEAEHICDILLGRLLRRDLLWGFDIERMLLDLFGFLAHEAYNIGAIETQARDALTRAREAIEARCHERLRIADLARIACMSGGHFSRSFKARYAETPIGYQTSLRIRAAKTLLRAGTLPVGEIAWRVGFPDIYEFSRVFKRIAGVAPRFYRERR
jgi:AraC-like DNA-binding protein